MFSPGSEGELRTRPFKPGKDGGEVRERRLTPGEDDARVVLLAARAPAGRGGASGTGEGEEGVSETLAGEGGNDTLVGGEEQDRDATDGSEWAIPDMPPPTDEPVGFEDADEGD